MGTKLNKDANTPVEYTPEKIEELRKCADDPIYMMENFMKVLHPVKGEVPFILYPYQRRMINAYKTHRMCIALTGRQMGKSSTFNTTMKMNDESIKIGNLIPMNLKEKFISWLEKIILKLSLK